MPPEETVGVVFGNVATNHFRFAVRDPTLKRLDYVQVEHPHDGALVAHVIEITRETSMSFDEAAMGGFVERAGAKRDHLVGEARVIGFRDARGLLQAPRTPVPAGAQVRRVAPEILAHVFGLRDTSGAYLGVVKGYDLRVHLDINTLVQKHVSVLAKTGAGKSYAVGVLMEELIKSGVPIVVIDPHGEHASLARPNTSASDQPSRRRFGVTPRNFAEHLVEYSPDTDANPDSVPFRLEATNLEAREINDLLGGKVTNSQMGLLHAAVRALRDKEKDYGLQDVLEEVREGASNAKWNVVSALETLVGLPVFSGPGTSVESLVQPRRVSILNLKGVAPDMQEMVVAVTARRLFEARKLAKVPPFMLVVEEAHNFAPEKGLSGTPSGMVLRTVASEGRKFGMGLAVVSQRPAKVDKNVLSQCNTQIILKVTNPNDLKALASSAEGFTHESEDEIQRLPVGVGFVSHPRISLPVLVEIRPRETSHGGESIDVMQSIRDADQEILGEAASDKPEEVAAAEDEDAAPTPAAAKRARQAKLPPPRESDEDERAPTHVPVVEPRAATTVPRTVAPLPRGPAAPQPPPWVEEVSAQERFVARADLAKLEDAHLRRLHDDLADRVRALSRLSDAPGADELRAKLETHLSRLQDTMEARERKARSLTTRLLALAKRSSKAPERKELSAATKGKGGRGKAGSGKAKPTTAKKAGSKKGARK